MTGMKDSEYMTLVNMIHRHHSWVDALIPKDDVTLMARTGVELMPVRRKVMTLVAVRSRSVYLKGHVWNIPEDRLDKALRTLRRDRNFSARWKSGNPTREDVDAIVLKATNGFLNIDLDKYD